MFSTLAGAMQSLVKPYLHWGGVGPLCALLLGAAGCGTSDDGQPPTYNASTEKGQGAYGAPSEPALTYETCGGACADPADRCVAGPSYSSICAPACSTASECPELSSTTYTGVGCKGGSCIPYSCTVSQVDHNKLVEEGRLCFRGEVVDCDSLEERPCTCGCREDEFCYQDLCQKQLTNSEVCTRDEHCLSGYCDPVQVFSGRCHEPVGSECVTGESACDCIAPEGVGQAGYCIGSCYVTGDGYCICKASGYVSTGTSCRPGCVSDAECRDYEACYFPDPAGLYGYCTRRSSE